MKKWGNAVLIIILITLFGCDSSTQKAENTKETDELTFVVASDGLPSTGQWRESIALFDIDGDGHMDIMAPRPRKASKEYDKPAVWYGDGKGNWSASLLDVPGDIGYDYGSIAVEDFDGDGIVDIALGMHAQGVKVLKGTDNGKYVDFSEGLPARGEFASRALVVADFTNDGIPDIAAASEGRFGPDMAYPSGARVFSWSKEGWSSHPVGDAKEVLGLFADQLTTGDVNGDGNRDIAIASLNHKKDLIVWVGDGKGGFIPFNQGLPQELHYPSVALADINRDGRDDLIARITGFGKKRVKEIRAFLSGPLTFTEISEGLPEGEAFPAVSASDLDGDGSAEIVGGTVEGGLKIFSRKDDRWQEVRVSGLPQSGLQGIYNVYLVDLNGDNHKDIVVNYDMGSGIDEGGIRVFLNVPRKD
jgi:hypothetical protein